MLREFKSDLAKAKKAEQLVARVLRNAEYNVQDVSNIPACYKKGDLLVTLPSGQQRYVEVKDDSRIVETRNILCEEESYLKDDDRYIDGSMRCDYDIYCVVSQAEGVLYLLDFKKLKEIYKLGEFKVIPHADQDSYCYLLPIGVAKKKGALIGIIDYENYGVVNYTI